MVREGIQSLHDFLKIVSALADARKQGGVATGPDAANRVDDQLLIGGLGGRNDDAHGAVAAFSDCLEHGDHVASRVFVVKRE